MVCKSNSNETEAQELTWQPLGSAIIAPTPQHAVTPGMPRAAAENHTVPVSDDDATGLRRRIVELELQYARELEKTRQSGLEQGLQQARRESAGEMEKALDRFARSLQELTQAKRRARNEAEAELVKLALAIARRILHREISTDPDSLGALVHAALQKLQNRDVARIRTFPGGIQTLRAALERAGSSSSIELISDAALEAGSLVFETSLGELDASVETQLKEIERGFADRLGHQ